MMAYAIATIVIMFCMIVAFSIYVVFACERKTHKKQNAQLNDWMQDYLQLENDWFNANMHIDILKKDKADLQEQLTEVHLELRKLHQRLLTCSYCKEAIIDWNCGCTRDHGPGALD